MFYHDLANLKTWKEKTHSSPSFCSPLLLLTEAIRFMRRLVVWASEGAVASACWAAVWGINTLPCNDICDRPLACPRPRGFQDLPFPIPRWASLLFLLSVFDILTLQFAAMEVLYLRLFVPVTSGKPPFSAWLHPRNIPITPPRTKTVQIGFFCDKPLHNFYHLCGVRARDAPAAVSI